MRLSSTVVRLFLSFAIALASSNALAAPVTNEDVINMAKAGLSEATILQAIAVGEPRFDTSADALIILKRAGVSEEVIRQMLSSNPAAITPKVSGTSSSNQCEGIVDTGAVSIRIVAGTGRHDLEPEEADITVESSPFNALIGALTFTLVPLTSSARASLPGPRSRLRLGHREPVFENILVKPDIPYTRAFKLVRMSIDGGRRVVDLAKSEIGLLTGSRAGAAAKESMIELKFDKATVCNFRGQRMLPVRIRPSVSGIL